MHFLLNCFLRMNSMAFVVKTIRTRKVLPHFTRSIQSFGGNKAEMSSDAKMDNENSISKKATISKSFAMNIFRGQIQVEQVFPFPQVLNDESRATLDLLVEPTEKFFREVNDADRNDTLAMIEQSQFDQLRELGAFGLQVPTELGGLGLSNTEYARLVEIVGAHDLGVAIMLGAHQSIGFKAILLYGNENQKRMYLPDLASGKKIAAFCLTEPSSGSDANASFSIKSYASKSSDGKHYVLNGNKIWISNGGFADVFTVFAKTSIQAKDGTVKDKVSAFIVERDFQGVTSGPPESKMGIKASNTAEVHFSDVKVPVQNLIGREGEGFKIAMNVLNNGRFGMAAAMSGTMKYCIGKAVEHAKNRTQFGRALIDFGGIREKIASMILRQYVTESMAYMISGIMDKGLTEFQVEAAISKIYSSEAAWYVCDETIQVLGGMGYMKECGVERVMRDLRIFRIFEGTNDILRFFVSLTGIQASFSTFQFFVSISIQYAGGHLQELQQALKTPLANYGLIRDEVIRRAKRIVKITSAASLVENVHPSLAECAKQVTHLVELYGEAVECLLLKYGKAIIEKQFLLIPLAEAAMYIFAMAVILSRASQTIAGGYSSSVHESKLCHLFCAIVSCLNCANSSTPAKEDVSRRLSLVGSPNFKATSDLMSEIAIEVAENGGLVHNHPLKPIV
ncbi:Very long-chain specific acyl-CoA dehydrogenase, mitochondrial [Trichinella zimbabwensis]|uniref:Very long-chain specific acyl-CoA dehydrogenase, mitochondrial n=1 Tax=Trichinella zimbabwensis TaxID=268475 RepID=A0A0V1H1F9_9BILA|nr:Very long-chain specific acyl-CoA dehydrogenase, mitochondrial [Trichinella zimbabwensis]